MTSHAAFAYLAQLRTEAGLDRRDRPRQRALASQLADIIKLVRKDKITTVFTEDLVSPKIADTIAKETGATTATLSPSRV